MVECGFKGRTMKFLFFSWQLVDGTIMGGQTNIKNNANHFTMQRRSHGLFSNRIFKGKHFKGVGCFAVFKIAEQNNTNHSTTQRRDHKLFSNRILTGKRFKSLGCFTVFKNGRQPSHCLHLESNRKRTIQQITSRQHNNRGLNASTCKSTSCPTITTQTPLTEDMTVSLMENAEGLIPQPLETSTRPAAVEQNSPPCSAV